MALLMLPRLRVVSVAALLAATWAPTCLAADDPPPVPSDPVFKALRVDGSTVLGRIRQLGPNGQVVLSDDAKETVIPFDRLVSLTREGDPPAPFPDGATVLFPDGDRLRAQIDNSTETAVETHPTLMADLPLSIPLDSLLALALVPAMDPAAQESLLAKLREEPRKSEVLLLNNDDRQPGGFLALKPDKVGFQRDNGPGETERGRVLAIEFDPKLAIYPQPKNSPWLELMFLDGSRLGANSVRIDQGKIVLETRFGATMNVPLTSLATAYVRGGPATYLAERKEALAEYVGYLGEHRKTYGRNRTSEGRVLKVGGRPYERGLGTQSRTLLAYRLEPGDQRFQATVGLDDHAGPLGSVVFRVLVDGKERIKTPLMTARDPARFLDVDLTGARVLILATDFGERGDVQDLADWIDARIIRGSDR